MFHKPRTVMWPVLLILLVGCQAAPITPAVQAQRVVTGSWGGQHVGLVLEPTGGKLVYDCATGEIAGPLYTDQLGRFSATGYHIPDRGGPDEEGYIPPRLAASYSGRVTGETMTLLVRVPSTGVDIGPMALRRNAPLITVSCL